MIVTKNYCITCNVHVYANLVWNFHAYLIRDWSKSMGGGPEQRGGGSSVFKRGGSFNFQLPLTVFLWGLAHI